MEILLFENKNKKKFLVEVEEKAKMLSNQKKFKNI